MHPNDHFATCKLLTNQPHTLVLHAGGAPECSDSRFSVRNRTPFGRHPGANKAIVSSIGHLGSAYSANPTGFDNPNEADLRDLQGHRFHVRWQARMDQSITAFVIHTHTKIRL